MCLEVKRTVSVRNFHVVREKQKKYKRIRMKRKKMSETEHKRGEMLPVGESRQRSYVYCRVSTS